MCKKCVAKLYEIDGRLPHFIDGLNLSKVPNNLESVSFLAGVKEFQAFKREMHTKHSLQVK